MDWLAQSAPFALAAGIIYFLRKRWYDFDEDDRALFREIMVLAVGVNLLLLVIGVCSQ